jgi:hypothetical protein
VKLFCVKINGAKVKQKEITRKYFASFFDYFFINFFLFLFLGFRQLEISKLANEDF